MVFVIVLIIVAYFRLIVCFILTIYILDETGMLIGLITHRPDSQLRKCLTYDKDGQSRNIVYNVARVMFLMFFSVKVFYSKIRYVFRREIKVSFPVIYL